MTESNLIRVLHVIGIMDRGGAETMIMNLYRNIDRTKVQFDFVVHGSKDGIYGEEIRKLGGQIYQCPKFSPQNYFAYRKWWKQFFEKEGQIYKVIHGHIGSSAAIYLGIAKGYGKVTIAHSHNSGTDHSIRQLMYNTISYPTRYIADYFFACSSAAGTDRFGKKVTKDTARYHILQNAIDTKQFIYSKDISKSVRQSLGYTEEEIIIGHIGRFATQKNHTFLLDIFNVAQKTNDKLRLLLVGDGPLRSEIEEKARKLKITDKISFLGVREDINHLMMAMDILLFPSLHEGLPVVLVEAQTTGLNCLISDTIPAESGIVKTLVEVENLSSTAEMWAEKLLKMIAEKGERCSCHEEVTAKGYDIKETSKWLEEFYIGKGTEKN